MRHTTVSILVISVLVVGAPQGQSGGAPVAGDQRAGQNAGIAAPQSLQEEHEAIHHALAEATKAPGRVGAAARELEAVLGPHFTRENQIALPPLGLLAALAAGEKPAGMAEALALTDALRKELPRMLQEHKQIRAATEKLRLAARDEKAAGHEQFAGELAAHARMEEEVLYPAAILVGDIIRVRMAQK